MPVVYCFILMWLQLNYFYRKKFSFGLKLNGDFRISIWASKSIVKIFHVLNFIFFYRFQNRPFYAWPVSAHLAYKVPGSISCSMSSSVAASQSSLSLQSLSTNEPVVSVEWLHANLREPDVKVYLSYFSFVNLNSCYSISVFRLPFLTMHWLCIFLMASF